MRVSIPEAVERLAAGGQVAYPTETVFGLGADATAAGALEGLRARKGRDARQGLSVLVEAADALARWGDPPPEAARLAERFWPGPLTLVIPSRHPALAGVATDDGVGFRCSSHPTARALARGLGRPLVSTSCNRSGEPPCADAEEIERVFGADLAIAPGEPGGGPPSTVVALRPGSAPRLLRAGAVGESAIHAALEGAA